MFRGRDLEFNAMTKHFYTDRSVPKKRLTEEQMVEINRLYRVIASSVVSTPRPQPPARQAAPATAVPVVSRAALAGGSVAVLLLVLALSMYRRRSGRES
jgi:hypothetical protein